MPGGRPRKPSALRQLEGNRSRTDIPPEPELHGTPQCPKRLVDKGAVEHFKFIAAEFGGAGILKRADSPALAMLADLWAKYWQASDEGDVGAMCKLKQRWDAAASKLGIQVVDRSRLLIGGGKSKPDETEERFFRTVG
jgi:hypothetical protein